VDSAERNGAKEAAALWKVNEALWEAEFGQAARASEYAKAAIATGSDRDVGVLAALALARAGESAQAEKILARLNAQFPLDSLLQHYWFPTVRAAIELDHGSAEAAIKALQGKTGYELGNPEQFNLGPMYPVYVRGEAYLKARREHDAAEQFRKIIEHPGVIVNFPLGSLAHLQLARALAVSGDTMGARREYQDFFALWKDADADIPILEQAKAEYRKWNRNSVH
jgi:predicted Zn-dependent protease